MQRPNYILLSCAIVLAVLLGVVGGGVMGGLAGYYTARNAAPTPAVAAPITIASSPSTATSVPPANTQTRITLSEESAVIDAVRKVKPAVVTVITQLPSSTRRTATVTPTASGSGVIIDEKGYVITNNHVIEDGKSVYVVFADGVRAEAKVVGTDVIADIAVLKVETKVPAVAALGDSNALQPGQMAIAIGSPLGDFRGTVTLGVVSAMNRSVGRQQDLIQTDAAINNGNSGGPLINTQGQVIGINTLVVRSTNEGNVAEGLGFAIPSNMVKEIATQLITKGKVERAYLGVTYQQVDPQIAGALNLQATRGIVIMSVEANTPAAQAGLKEGDVILALDGQIIDAEHPLATMLLARRVGDAVTLQVQRDGKTFDLKATLSARPAGR